MSAAATKNSDAMSVGIVRFPGTNCDRDIWYAVESVGLNPEWLWHRNRFDIETCDAVILAGGFSYGDYLRSGALAAKAPVMESVRQFAESGKPILGICNGFQILCESGLLPGALVQNESGLFVDRWSPLKGHHKSTSFVANDTVCLPVAHGDGRFFHPNPEELFANDEVWWTYEENPNGSTADIAGVRKGNVYGLMPHPERALFEWMGGSDGHSFFAGLSAAKNNGGAL